MRSLKSMLTAGFLALALVVAGASGPARAQELKLATLAPDGSGWMEILREAAGEVAERTDEGVRVRFYPGGVMGDASTVLRRMRMGQLHGGAFTLGDLAPMAPEANLYGLPFLFRDADELATVREEFDRVIQDGLEAAGLVAPAISNGGFAYLFSRTPIPPAGEVDSDLRVWVQEGDRLSRRVLSAAGASPVPLAMSEVYTALQTGTVNAFASTTAGAIILQWHSRAKHLLDQPVLMTAGTVAIDQRALQRLSGEHREILMEVFGDAIRRLEERSVRENRDAREALAEQGIEFHRPDPEDARAWQRLAMDELDEMLASGDLEVPGLERLRERLGELRNDDGD